MARLSTYVKDTNLADDDLLAGSNYISGTGGTKVYETANFPLGALKTFIAGTGRSVVERTFTPAEMLAFNNDGASPGFGYELVAAPGADKAIVPVEVYTHVDFQTTAYNFASTLPLFQEYPLFIGYGGNLSYPEANPIGMNSIYIAIGDNPGTLGATASKRNIWKPALNSDIGIPSGQNGSEIFLNQPILLWATPMVTVTQGDSPVTFRLIYDTIDFSS